MYNQDCWKKNIPKKGDGTIHILSKNLIEEHRKRYSYLHIRLIQVGLQPLTKQGLNIAALIIVRDKRHNKFNDSLLGVVKTSLSEVLSHFKCFIDFSVASMRKMLWMHWC